MRWININIGYIETTSIKCRMFSTNTININIGYIETLFRDNTL